jgi:hypothetical protein
MLLWCPMRLYPLPLLDRYLRRSRHILQHLLLRWPLRWHPLPLIAVTLSVSAVPPASSIASVPSSSSSLIIPPGAIVRWMRPEIRIEMRTAIEVCVSSS